MNFEQKVNPRLKTRLKNAPSFAKFNSKLLKSIVPLLLLAVMCLIIFSFFLSENGYLKQKEKINNYKYLIDKYNKLNTEVINLIQYKENLIKDDFFIEKEARKVALKRKDEKIINLHYEEFIDTIGKLIFTSDHKNKQNSTTFKTYEVSVSWQFYFIIGILIISFLTFLILAIYSHFKSSCKQSTENVYYT